MRINPHLRQNASKYLEWLPRSLADEMTEAFDEWDVDFHKELQEHPLAVLLASIYRAPIHDEGQLQWKQRIIDDLRLVDYKAYWGGGWNAGSWDILKRVTRKDYEGWWYGLEKRDSFVFTESTIHFDDFINWDSSPLEGKI